MMYVEAPVGHAQCRCCHDVFNRLEDPHGNIVCDSCHVSGCNNSGCKRELYVTWQRQMNADTVS